MKEKSITTIEENFSMIMDRVTTAASRADRDPAGVILLAASKTRSPGEIEAAHAAGVSVFGENRVQEFLEKKQAVTAPVAWHFIGHLQRNKVRSIIGEVDLVHSVDSSRLLKCMDERAAAAGVVQPVLLQVNFAGEETKSGFSPGELPGLVETLGDYANLQVEGLSTIAPDTDEESVLRPVFAGVRELGHSCERYSDLFSCRILSMGMSNDFEIAVEEGSNCIRVGSSLFGLRLG